MNKSATELQRRLNPFGLADAANAFFKQALRNGTIIAVNRSKVFSRSAIPSIPKHYYDTAFTCKKCGAEEVWTAKRQQWWYEEQGGEIESVAIHCRACRRKERVRRDAARKTHLEGLAKKKSIWPPNFSEDTRT